jgi:hypothetical protein
MVFLNQYNASNYIKHPPNLSTTTATRRKLTGLRTAASIMHREARSACLKPSFVCREPQLNHPNSNWN